MWMRLLLALPILLLPNMLHVPIDTGIPGLNLANLLFAVLLVALGVGGHGSDPMPPSRGKLTVPLLLFFLTLVVGFAVAQLAPPLDFSDDFTYLKTAIFYPLFYFVYRRSRQDLRGTRQLLILMMVVAAVAGLEAIREGLDYGIGHYAPSHRASGPFGTDYHNANRAGVFYAMFLPMFIAIALFFRRRKFWRIAAIIGCVILAAAIMATYSRQAYLIGLFALAFLLLRRNVLLAALAGMLMVASVSLIPDSVTQRVQETQQSTNTGNADLDISTASRFDIWTGALQMWRAHPAGIGLNRFKYNIGNYSSYAGYDAHNFYVLTLAECGPLGLVALLWLVWRMWTLARGVGRSITIDDPEARALALGFPVVVISMALGNLFGSPFLEGSVMANFWILCGLMERYAALQSVAHGRLQRDAGAAVSTDPMVGRYPMLARYAPGRRSLK